MSIIYTSCKLNIDVNNKQLLTVPTTSRSSDDAIV